MRQNPGRSAAVTQQGTQPMRARGVTLRAKRPAWPLRRRRWNTRRRVFLSSASSLFLFNLSSSSTTLFLLFLYFVSYAPVPFLLSCTEEVILLGKQGFFFSFFFTLCLLSSGRTGIASCPLPHITHIHNGTTVESQWCFQAFHGLDNCPLLASCLHCAIGVFRNRTR